MIAATRHTVVTLAAAMLLASCAAPRPAPVSDARAGDRRPAPSPDTRVPAAPAPAEPAPAAVADRVHVIQKGDTLISVALQNGLDYRELAAWNNIENPNVIRLGQSLRLTPPGAAAVAGAPAGLAGAQPKPGEPVATPLVMTPMPATPTPLGNTERMKTEPKGGRVPYTDQAYARLSAEPLPSAAPSSVPSAAPSTVSPAAPVAGAVPPGAGTAAPAVALSGTEDIEFAWPIQPPPKKDRLLATFTEAGKGIDIAGAKNSPVLAAAAGKVIYVGSSIRGYGRLVIIKHNAMWLSAYAHNEKILVAEEQDVKKGQRIAEMGSSDSENDKVKLHFEVRKQGRPLDPLKFLPPL